MKIFKNLYCLIFYKLFKVSSLLRSDRSAVFTSSIGIGFAIVAWLIYLFGLFNIRKFIPNFIVGLLFTVSFLINIIYLNSKNKAGKIILLVKEKKMHFFYHFIAYLLLAWTFVGLFFL
jgi:hypothetical protein